MSIVIEYVFHWFVSILVTQSFPTLRQFVSSTAPTCADISSSSSLSSSHRYSTISGLVTDIRNIVAEPSAELERIPCSTHDDMTTIRVVCRARDAVECGESSRHEVVDERRSTDTAVDDDERSSESYQVTYELDRVDASSTTSTRLVEFVMLTACFVSLGACRRSNVCAVEHSTRPIDIQTSRDNADMSAGRVHRSTCQCLRTDRQRYEPITACLARRTNHER
jgi:hypothetical protein